MRDAPARWGQRGEGLDDDMDEKRTETICARVTERMALDILREATRQDRKISDWVFLLIRRELYERASEKSTSTT